MAVTELTFTEVDEIPKLAREGGGAKPREWEVALAPLKDRAVEAIANGTPNKPYIVWKYSKKTGGDARIGAVRKRLLDKTPEDHWTMSTRPIPDSDPVEFGVYVRYEGQFTPAQVLENATKRHAAGQRIVAARKAADEARKAQAEAEAAPVAGQIPTGSPAERVAAAKRVAGK